MPKVIVDLPDDLAAYLDHFTPDGDPDWTRESKIRQILSDMKEADDDNRKRMKLHRDLGVFQDLDDDIPF